MVEWITLKSRIDRLWYWHNIWKSSLRFLFCAEWKSLNWWTQFCLPTSFIFLWMSADGITILLSFVNWTMIRIHSIGPTFSWQDGVFNGKFTCITVTILFIFQWASNGKHSPLCHCSHMPSHNEKILHVLSIEIRWLEITCK